MVVIGLVLVIIGVYYIKIAPSNQQLNHEAGF